MILEKYRNYNDDIFIRPVDKKDKNLFRHCAFGHAAYPNKYFKKEVESMLFAHGVFHIKTIDRTRKPKSII